MELRPATLEERKRFYAEEWNKRELPDFILHTLSLREFGFDLDGSGPNNRYNQFITVEQLESFLKNRFPYSAYASVALYEQPSMRKGWLKAELVFDIDAKDLPARTCGCSEGTVCLKCLGEARHIAAMIGDTLRSDLGLSDISFVYSGRGFHIRVADESVMQMGPTERAKIVEYVTGGVLPDVRMTRGEVPVSFQMKGGYGHVYWKRVLWWLDRFAEGRYKARELLDHQIGKKTTDRLIENREQIAELIKKGKAVDINEVFGVIGQRKALSKVFPFFAELNLRLIDGKVTVDTKRILRLPSTLHSGVSMKCTIIRDMEHFSLDDAIPKFMRE
jgi:DNA primase small subunit